MAKSSARGARTSAELEVQVLGLTPHALWISIGGREHMLDFERFPWFARATMVEICDVTLDFGVHLRWPQLDVDLHTDSLENPQHFPLVARVRKARVRRTVTD